MTTAAVPALLLGGTVLAAPHGAVVSAGSAAISVNGSTTLITQGTDRAAIDWQTFNVGTNESVVFRQPSSTAITLNRIYDQNPSQILGSITANGQVILSNPNGMIFGKGSKIDVAGLVATTASIGSDAFMQSGPLKLTIPGTSNAKIIANGSITAKDAGLVAFLAPNVENNGIITAKLGKVQLAGAETATLDLYGDGLVSLAVTNAEETSVKHTGTIQSHYVALTAVDAANLIGSTVNVDGIIDSNDSHLNADGSLTFGGKIEVTARDVILEKNARLRATGKDGGGIVKVGGGWQGKGTIKNAKNTTVKSGARINASAIDNGNGGTVAVWADDTSKFDGTILAKGGPSGGNGGHIETSGKVNLAVSGFANASSPLGTPGEWLLDPQNVRISNAGVNSVPTSGGTYDPTGAVNPYTILDTSITDALNNGNNVTITTVNNGQGQSGSIELANVNIAKNNGGDTTLTLKADSGFFTTGSNSFTSNTGKLNLIFWADADNQATGSYLFFTTGTTTLTSNGGNITIGGGLDPVNNPITTASGAGITISNSFINAGGGDISIRGSSAGSGAGMFQHGVSIDNGSQITTTNGGKIFIKGIGGAGTGSSFGIRLNGTPNIETATGTLTIEGTGGTGGANNRGIALETSPTVISASGTITMTTDNIQAFSATSTTRTNGSIIVKPLTTGASIGVSGGTCGGSCTLNLDDTSLSRLFADNDGNGVGSLIIGDSAAGTGTVDINGWDFSNKTYDVEVYGGTVDLTGNVVWNGPNDVLLYSRTGNLIRDFNLTRNAGTAGDGTLTLKAAGNVSTSGANRTIIAATAGATGKLHTILWSDADNNGEGLIFNSGTSNITTNNGDLILAGGLDNGANNGIAGDGRPDGFATSAGNTGIDIRASTLSTGNGNIIAHASTTNAAASYGMQIVNNATLQSTGGNISILSRSYSGGSDAHGIAINSGGSGTTGVFSETGDISIDTQYLGAGTGTGIVFWDNASVATTGSGDIFIKGVGTTSGIYANSGSQPASYVGGGLMTGDITLEADSLNSWGSNFSIQTAGEVTFKPINSNVTMSVAGVGGNINITTSMLSAINAGTIVFGQSNTGLITVNPYATWASRASSGVEFNSGSGGITFAAGTHDFGTRSLSATTSGALGINGALTVGSTLMRATSATSDITLGAAGSVSASGAGDPIILSAGRNFINNNPAASALSAPAARWLVYSTDPAADTKGALVSNLVRYGCTYPACTGFSAGFNGFLYSIPGSNPPNSGPSPTIPAGPQTPSLPETPSVPGIPSIPQTPPVPGMLLQDFLGQLDRIALTQTSKAFFALGSETGTSSDYFWTTERNLEEDMVYDDISTKANLSVNTERNLEERPLYSLSRALKQLLKSQQ